MKTFFRKLWNFMFGKFRRRVSRNKYYKRFNKNAFVNGIYKNQQQYEAQITKMYHSVEKGLAYKNFRSGFGRKNVDELISALESYSNQYDVEAFFYKTALSVLDEYITKNEAHGYVDAELKTRIENLPGEKNAHGGALLICHAENSQYSSYKEFVLSRHSVREFSGAPVDVESIKEAVSLAQYTPSACNRQGWRSRIIVDKETIKTILANQNGNKGFGEHIDKLLIITCDLRYFAKGRELHQAYIDGGMYAMNVLHALHSKNIATIPLSASLRGDQETEVRNCANIQDSEVLILFIGVGSYPDEVLTTKSERHEPRIEII